MIAGTRINGEWKTNEIDSVIQEKGEKLCALNLRLMKVNKTKAALEEISINIWKMLLSLEKEIKKLKEEKERIKQ
jgi:hypothetical protein